MVLLVLLARSHEVFPGDEWALKELRQWRAESLNVAITVLYLVGWGAYLLPYLPIGIVVFVGTTRRWRDGLLLAAAGILPPLLNLVLKELVARPRPDSALALVQETGYAFPSSHAVFVVGFYGSLIYLLGQWEGLANKGALRRAIQAILMLFILAVGASRVYSGVHWPSDVIGGFLFGSLCLALLIAAYRLAQAKA